MFCIFYAFTRPRYVCSFVFAYANSRFSHDVAHYVIMVSDQVGLNQPDKVHMLGDMFHRDNPSS